MWDILTKTNKQKKKTTLYSDKQLGSNWIAQETIQRSTLITHWDIKSLEYAKELREK